MIDSNFTCQNCQNQYKGRFCNQCGERRFDAEQRKISVLFATLIQSLFELDGKLIRSIRYFFTRPGFLAYEHSRGVRKPYITPVAFFLITNLVFFIFSPITDFAQPLDSQQSQPYGPLVQSTIDSYLLEQSISMQVLSERYDVLSETIAKSIVILSVPFLIPFIWLANPNKKFYLIDHSVSALYLYAFVLVWPMIVTPLLTFLFWVTEQRENPDGLLLLLLLTPYYLYAAFFQKFMYRDIWWKCLLKAWVITIGIIISHFIFRFLQFWIVWWQMA
jgi:hypothetical protein